MKFNEKAKEPNQTLNHEGARAYMMSAEMELYTAVVTSMLNDNFYEKGGERLNRIKNLVKKTDPQFVARLAVYARTQMNLRSVPLLLTVALASVHSGDDLVARTVALVVQRADEITELLACYQKLNPTGDKRKKLAKVSNQILKGLKRIGIVAEPPLRGQESRRIGIQFAVGHERRTENPIDGKQDDQPQQDQ